MNEQCSVSFATLKLILYWFAAHFILFCTRAPLRSRDLQCNNLPPPSHLPASCPPSRAARWPMLISKRLSSTIDRRRVTARETDAAVGLLRRRRRHRNASTRPWRRARHSSRAATLTFLKSLDFYEPRGDGEVAARRNLWMKLLFSRNGYTAADVTNTGFGLWGVFAFGGIQGEREQGRGCHWCRIYAEHKCVI